jgi:flagellin-like protein
MRLKRLLTDDDAVSPVIGVILMVAITVILAAVIASFVLGLGDQAGNVAPQASFTSDYDSNDGNVTITHDSGDSIVATEVYFRGSNFWGSDRSNTTWQNYSANNNATISGNVEGQDAVTAGDRAEFNATNSYEMRVVWESSGGESSNTMLEDTGPQA